ncbi:PIG-L deacetylase family protein [Limnoglobus roseus]|uniref:CE14 family carbohydrate esterase n=1 Tax=Limnoglobus roseus TaxID=2598579 RepID=A0A5C1AA74_9BACT|nr:PIG-L deacetylase family protein [Limnoglobus roseus]QEL16289.1 CE14 family carbohydrate esterase [Limnoglobus roseus]
MSKTILAVLAHPDDAEFLCAGVMVRLQREHGWALHIATMTPGDCGSTEYPPEEIARIRRSEGNAAAKAIGATYHCLEERDLRVVYGEAVLEKTVRLINKVQADVVLTHSPDDYHLDHEQTSKIVRAATFAAPIPNFLHGRHDHPPIAHIPHLYYCDPLEGKDAFGRPIPPSFRVDISSAIDAKSKMLECHESQRAWLRSHHGVDNLVESMRHWSAAQAEGRGVAFAEGFRQHLGHSYPQGNLLGELLGVV